MEILKQTEEKIRATEAFYQVARYLTSNPCIRVDRGQDIQKWVDDHRFWRSVVSHILYAIILENTIKILWEVEHGQECAHTHNIKRIYNELNKKTKRDIETMYQEKTDVFKKMSGNRAGKKIKLGEIVDLASWEQALESNEITMKNFKYDHYCPDVLS